MYLNACIGYNHNGLTSSIANDRVFLPSPTPITASCLNSCNVQRPETSMSNATMVSHTITPIALNALEESQSLASGSIKTSKYRGVSLLKGKGLWRARVEFKGKRQHLGYFESEIEAAYTYDEKVLQLFGIHAKFNFPDRIKILHPNLFQGHRTKELAFPTLVTTTPTVTATRVTTPTATTIKETETKECTEKVKHDESEIEREKTNQVVEAIHHQSIPLHIQQIQIQQQQLLHNINLHDIQQIQQQHQHEMIERQNIDARKRPRGTSRNDAMVTNMKKVRVIKDGEIREVSYIPGLDSISIIGSNTGRDKLTGPSMSLIDVNTNLFNISPFHLLSQRMTPLHDIRIGAHSNVSLHPFIEGGPQISPFNQHQHSSSSITPFYLSPITLLDCKNRKGNNQMVSDIAAMQFNHNRRILNQTGF